MRTQRNQEREDRVADHTRVDFPRIDPDLTLEDARERLFLAGAERLIVGALGEVLGLVSIRDLNAAEASGIPSTQTVRSILHVPVHCAATTKAAVATRRLASAHATSAVVVEGGKPVGVFAPADVPRPHRRQRPRRRPGRSRRTRASELVASHHAAPSAEATGRILHHDGS